MKPFVSFAVATRAALWVGLFVVPAAALSGEADVATDATKAAPASPALVARGRLMFLRCASCHEVEQRGVVKIGPTLQGVFGRPAAAVAGYAYSPGLRDARLQWDAPTLDAWIEKPTRLVPTTTMAFIGLPSAEDRQALIAYLQTLK